MQDLIYEDGSFVRSASGIVSARGKPFLIIQDDASFIAAFDALGDPISKINLPYAPDGQRTFSDEEGNKKLKLDLEACMYMPDGTFLALGSGSKKIRKSLVTWDLLNEPVIHPAKELFDALEKEEGFGGELNVEGIASDGKHWVDIFQRGNGKGAENAKARIDLNEWLRWIRNPDTTLKIDSSQRFNCGAMDTPLGAIPYTITDACFDSERGIYLLLLAVEATDNAIDDGEVMGSALVQWDVSQRYGSLRPFETPGNTPIKFEGICIHDGQLLLVNDMDDPKIPSAIYEAQSPL